ncbi:uncharacterized protein NFIA_047390 [Aspergillus fischeri NRRL 181]|uniref:Uncharacterized protein n=1 Tax=Neosartorya fischeri (strain ATCC 1020 / DSM 3700 / CBS 544.65 / FGSC A1164 / JCM 1740 / NRRL 181 / WB 181) TaxID=331117 RepID=A1DKT3_NEOFI|nr:uncharacterized protein NFIA_047390 [Aspergillus fischeri NRRL 181]EAW15404.1 hypothetical protein NFIA_047390 [Aspergillus fischeri NRRL 181]
MVSAVVHPASTDIEATSNDIDAVNVLKANAQQAAKDLYQENFYAQQHILQTVAFK